MGSLSLPELLIIVPIILIIGAVLLYRMGYNAGYRKVLEKAFDERSKRPT